MRPLPDADGERGVDGSGAARPVLTHATDGEPSAARDAQAAQASASTEAADPATEMWASEVADQQAARTTMPTSRRRWRRRVCVAVAAVSTVIGLVAAVREHPPPHRPRGVEPVPAGARGAPARVERRARTAAVRVRRRRTAAAKRRTHLVPRGRRHRSTHATPSSHAADRSNVRPAPVLARATPAAPVAPSPVAPTGVVRPAVEATPAEPASGAVATASPPASEEFGFEAAGSR